MLQHGFSGIEDYRLFDNRRVEASATPASFVDATGAGRVPQHISVPGSEAGILDAFLRGSDTSAFLVLHSDTLLYERYFGGHTAATPSLGFSMTKSVVALLVGTAIDDGLIGSVEDPVTTYLPELEGLERVTLRHLLQMTSGLDYTESDNPFGLHARLYYCERCLDRAVRDFELAEPPGIRFRYKSGDNLLLAAVLRRALNGESLAAYLERRIWRPLGMEHPALWSTDGEVEKSWCCLAATARDFARIGRLYAQEGQWGGRQVVSADWVGRAARVSEADGASWTYQFHWWHPFRERSDFMMIGHLEQYVYVNPETDVVIVRLGSSGGGVERRAWQTLLADLSDSIHSI
jgi:CubicO group peptidase (beta-lactamase class C family)